MSKPNYIFTGARGSGKTYAALALARRRETVLYIDPTSTVKSMSYTDTDPKKIAEVIRRYPTFRACLWVGHLKGEEMREAIAPVIAEAEAKSQWVTVVIDEVGVVCPGRTGTDEIERSARMGRHNKTSFWFISQRATDVSQNLRAQCERMFVYRTASARDVENIRREYGRDAAEAVTGLDGYEYVLIDTQKKAYATRTPIEAPEL